MFLRVKVEEKIRHYTLSSREWINVLYVTPSSEDPPLGLIDHQSRLLSPGTQVVLTCIVVLLVGERNILNHVL